MVEEMLSVVHDDQIDPEQFFRALPASVRNHARRVSELSDFLLKQAMENGLYEDEYIPFVGEKLKLAVLYHDIGLVLVPERILDKCSSLTDAEYKVIQKHTGYGAKLLNKYRKAGTCPKGEEGIWPLAAEIAVSHHERWDGKGYPFGLLATAVPFIARVVSLAGAYDTIVSEAPYRMALPHEYALLEIMDNAGTQFDPELAGLFRICEKEIFKIYVALAECGK